MTNHANGHIGESGLKSGVTAPSSSVDTKEDRQGSTLLSHFRKNWRNVLVVMFLWTGFFFCNVAYSTIYPFFPQIAASKNVSSFFVGVIIGIAPLVVMFLSPVVGYLLPRIGVSLPVFLGLLLVGSACLSMGFVTWIPSTWAFITVCIFLRVLEGVGTSFLATSIFSTFPQLFPKATGTLMALFEMGTGLGYSVGYATGGVMYHYGGYRLPFVAVGSAVLFFVIPCPLLVWKIKVVVEHKKKQSLSASTICRLSTNLLFVTLVLVMVVAYTPGSYLVASLPGFLKEEYHKSPLMVSIVYLCGTVTYLIATLFMGPIIDKMGYNRCFSVSGLLVIILGYLMITVPYDLGVKNILLICAAFVAFQLGNSLNMIPVYGDLLSLGRKYMRHDDNDDALSSFVSGIVAAALNLSLFQAQIIGGTLSSYFSLPTICLIIAEIMGACALLLAGISLIDKIVDKYSVVSHYLKEPLN